MKYVTVAEMQAIEREADAAGLSYAQMMENAGNALAEVVLDESGYLEEGGALGLVGPGNNGGDTLVALARLAGEDWRATAVLVRPRPQNDPLVERLCQAGGEVYDMSAAVDLECLHELLGKHSVLLDGVLGTGTRLPLKPELAVVLDYLRRTLADQENPPEVVAVDCPSGIDCDSGEAALECIPADYTVTMAAVKQGLYKFPAYRLVGDLHVVGIGLPEDGAGLQAWQAVQTFVPDEDWVSQALPPRPLDAHKGTFGTVLAIAGSINYTGAAWLAGQAAYRSGAGLVTLAVPEPLHGALAGQFPEATWLPLPHQDGFIAESAVERVLPGLGNATALLVGPGFGLAETSARFLERLLKEAGGRLPPAVFDADGLKLLARLPNWPQYLPDPAILTPHPGEMAILTGLSKDVIQSERLEIARRFSQEWNQIVILKGAFSVIAAPDGQAAILPVASPALARAGTGDVLAGLAAGLRAQGMDAFPAAVAAAWIHAQAGLQAGRQSGNPATVLAGDLLPAVVQVMSHLL